MEEIWKDVVGFENLYEVSNLGNVRSLDRYVSGKLNSKRFQKGKNMTIQKTPKGYYSIILHKNGMAYQMLVHRLVAIAFIENKSNKDQVNHLDLNKSNNNMNNLEWCTNLENMRHSYANGGHSGFTEKQIAAVRKNQLKAAEKRSRKVCQFDKEMNFIKSYRNSIEASKKTGSCASKISACCAGHRKTCNDFIWKYEKEILNAKNNNGM
jgi:hypothetical protein